MSKSLNILYQSNDYYSVITGVSLTSLLINNKEITDLNVYLLNDAISEVNLNKLKEVCDEYHRRLIIVDTDLIIKELKSLGVKPFKNTYTTYFKLMSIDQIVLNNGVLFAIDGDTIITKSLISLCDFDFEDHLIAATYDCTMNSYKKLIGIPLEDHFYNCGVLLINQKKWIEEGCKQKIVDHLLHERSGYYTADQDIINVLFRNRIRYLDLKYNFNSGFFIYGIKNSIKMYKLNNRVYNTSEEVETAQKDIHLYHCMGAMTGRPWEKGNIHPQNDLFDHYLNCSPWRDYEKKRTNRNWIFTVQRDLYLVLPRFVYIQIHKVFQYLYLYQMNEKVKKN